MTTWSDLEAAAPDLAAAGRRLLGRRGAGEALIATVRGEGLPRIHPINVEVVDGNLYAFLLPSAKRGDLESDGRFALHTVPDPDAPSEFAVRGRATLVTDEATRGRVAAEWSFEPDDTYGLFELSIESALLGLRETADDWPPRYTSWRP
jgi:hypothetical protein